MTGIDEVPVFVTEVCMLLLVCVPPWCARGIWTLADWQALSEARCLGQSPYEAFMLLCDERTRKV